MLTGVNAVGVGEASGMFPIDERDAATMTEACWTSSTRLIAEQRPCVDAARSAAAGRCWPARTPAGKLTEAGAAPPRWPCCPRACAFAPAGGRRGHRHDRHERRRPAHGQRLRRHVHLRHGGAGASAAEGLSGDRHCDHARRARPVAMVHCNNCTNDINAWAGVLRETAGAVRQPRSTRAICYTDALQKEP